MTNNTCNLWYPNLPYLITIIIGICSFLFALDMSYLGDNLDYSADSSKKIIEILDKNPEFDIAMPTMGYSVTSLEIGGRQKSIFNPAYVFMRNLESVLNFWQEKPRSRIRSYPSFTYPPRMLIQV